MKRRRLCILLNNLNEYDFQDLVRQYLPEASYDVTVTEAFPANPSEYLVIIPWNYKKIIPEAEEAGNVVVLHSSNLPEGRGWAPIYYAFSEQRDEFVISGILAANEVDAGDVVIRARFAMEAGYTAPFIREIDRELSLLLIAKILENWPNGRPSGIRQSGVVSHRIRRHPVDNQIDPGRSVLELLPHLRGVEGNSPAFFYVDDVKYLIEIRPQSRPNKPATVTIEYPVFEKTETWTGWAS